MNKLIKNYFTERIINVVREKYKLPKSVKPNNKETMKNLFGKILKILESPFLGAAHYVKLIGHIKSFVDDLGKDITELEAAVNATKNGDLQKAFADLKTLYQDIKDTVESL